MYTVPSYVTYRTEEDAIYINCWNRLPQKSSHVNVNLSGRGPSILLRKTVLSLKSPTGAFIAPLRFANANF